MKAISVLGIDLAKSVFQLHGVDERGRVSCRKRLGRDELADFVANLRPCLIGMEVCGGSNYWALKFEQMGHTVKQIAPQFVKPYRKSDKNDANDAEAICEAVSRPNMRFVPTKPASDQDMQSVHRIRYRLVGQRTALCNEIRGLLLEYGVVVPKSVPVLRKKLPLLIDDTTNGLTSPIRETMSWLHQELVELDLQIVRYEFKLKVFFDGSELCKRLSKIGGLGLISTTAIVASHSQLARAVKNGRQFSAALGLVPRQNSSGKKVQLLSITKKGDPYTRTLLVHGARAFIRVAKNKPDRTSLWVTEKVRTRGHNRACVALANKNARTIWSMINKGTEYTAP